MWQQAKLLEHSEKYVTGQVSDGMIHNLFKTHFTKSSLEKYKCLLEGKVRIRHHHIKLWMQDEYKHIPMRNLIFP